MCKNTALTATEILELYVLRWVWVIEVCFKEAKQHLGLLKEKSNHNAAYIASIYLPAIWFCLLVMAKQTQEYESITQICPSLCCNRANISFAAKLWHIFRAIITWLGLWMKWNQYCALWLVGYWKPLKPTYNTVFCKPSTLIPRHYGLSSYKSVLYGYNCGSIELRNFSY